MRTQLNSERLESFVLRVGLGRGTKPISMAYGAPMQSKTPSRLQGVHPIRHWRGRMVHAAALVTSIVLASTGARAQTGPIKVVIPFPAGGSADTLMRLSTERIARLHNITFIIENRPGAGTVIATEAVSRAAPDGNTLLANANSFVINPHLRKLPYDPLNSFEPICALVSSPQVIVVNSASPYSKLADLVAAAKAHPGELTMASLGPATAQHIAVEQLKRAAGINVNFLPYPGNVPAVTALLGEHVTSVLANFAEVAGPLQSGKLRAVATTAKTRLETLPNIPTVAEQGYVDYEATVWLGVVAPAKTSPEILARLGDWFRESVQSDEVRPKLVELGLFPMGLCGASFATFMQQQSNDYGRSIRAANITLQ
jgi:tripartite-type tricarboxylate transporter receptor subunit TctC